MVNPQATVDEQLLDMQPHTHFDYAMEALGVSVILAHSPQAMGRVERLFKTLQDRLVKELRLQGIDTLEGANGYLWQSYLPMHNARCAVVAQEAQNAHRSTLSQAELATVFGTRETRLVQHDYTVKCDVTRINCGAGNRCAWRRGRALWWKNDWMGAGGWCTAAWSCTRRTLPGWSG